MAYIAFPGTTARGLQYIFPRLISDTSKILGSEGLCPGEESFLYFIVDVCGSHQTVKTDIALAKDVGC